MNSLVKYDLGYVYRLKKGYKVFLGYETELNNEEKITLNFSPRRNKDFFIKPNSDVKVIIYSRSDEIYIVDSVEKDAKGIGRVADVLKKHSIPFEPTSSEGWQSFKHSSWIQSYIYVYDKGYFTWQHLWLDIAVWNIDMVSKDGIEIIGGDIIKETHYEKVGGEIPKEHYKFLEKMLTEGCTLDEYEDFKNKFVNVPAVEIKYKEVK